ncbi:MAG: hypothetical protein KBC30_05900 [Planctomycetes bacterium]|nr:hypothetical protein [Planctomycetota bacterium]
MKKSTPRGYSEFIKFIDDMSSGRIWDEVQEEPSEVLIENFIEDCYKKQLAVSRCLLEAMLENQDNDLKSSTIAMILSRMIPDKMVDHIADFIKNKEVKDKTRKKLFLVLEKYNKTEIIPELLSYFQNKDTLIDYLINNIIKKISTPNINIEHYIQYLKKQNLPFFDMLIQNILQRTDDKSTWILGMLAEHSDYQIAEKAIAALKEKNTEISQEILDTLITHPQINNVPKQSPLLGGYGMPRPIQKAIMPHKCYLSWLDGDGNQIFLVSRRTGRGLLYTTSFILNVEHGIYDCIFCNNISSFENDNMIKDLEVNKGLKQIDYSLGIRFLEHAIWKTLSQHQLLFPNFLIARRIFGGQKLSAKKYNVQENQLGIQYILQKYDELIDQSHKLLQDKPFQDWWVNTPETIAFFNSHPALKAGKKCRKDNIIQFIETIIEPQRKVWQERFIMTCEFLHRTSPRIYRQHIEISLALYIALRDNGDLTQIPFFQELTELTITKLSENEI